MFAITVGLALTKDVPSKNTVAAVRNVDMKLRFFTVTLLPLRSFFDATTGYGHYGMTQVIARSIHTYVYGKIRTEKEAS